MKMTFEEYKKAVWEELQKYAVATEYPDDAKKIFDEEIEDTQWHFKNGYSVADTAWGLSLLI